MKKVINTVKLVGRVYEHNLSVKTVKNEKSANYGKPFIAGTIDIATDEEGLNVVTHHFTYVAETNASGANRTYTALQKIINEGKAWITDGKDAATKVEIGGAAVALNDFYGSDGNLVSAKRSEGGFVTILSELPNEDSRNRFDVDMVITGVVRTEADEERHIKEPYVTVKGAVFSFRGDLLPVDFIIRNEAGMNYFEGLEASNSNPVFTKVWGKIANTTIRREKIEESAFGPASVQVSERKVKEWLLTGAIGVPYEFGEESTLTAEELMKAMQNREVYLAEVKKNHDDYLASKATAARPAASTPTPAPAKTPMGNFSF